LLDFIIQFNTNRQYELSTLLFKLDWPCRFVFVLQARSGGRFKAELFVNL